MDQLEATLRSILAPVSRLLDPVLAQLARLEFLVTQQLLHLGVPSLWAGVLVTAAWVIVLLMALRVAPGWLRVVLLLLVGLVVLKARGMLPG